MYSIIIAANLSNDFCNPLPQYSSNRVNIGTEEGMRLFGSEDGKGILPQFLEATVNAKKNGDSIGILLVRDLHDPEDESQSDELARFGNHCLTNTAGAEFISPVQAIIEHVEILDTSSMAISLETLRISIRNLSGIDILTATDSEKRELSFLVTGVHSERWVFNTAQ